MKWKNAEIACMNKLRYKTLKKAEDAVKYLFEKHGSKQYIYWCHKTKEGHYHLTTQAPANDNK